ncbi:hypothetical protein [uncultured Algibacter sp.]|uniref:hypothetical protein n=1 Tax=uncultured Algibacter sp. TaxID=298659 RepID=UPI0026264ACB|nr:hypothetical protein [uncultured Algibacter sp.]
MQKSIILLLFISIVIFSCKEKKSKIELVKKYFETLNNSEFSNVSSLLSDSILSKEVDYKMMFYKEDYLELLKWDSTFKPEYKVINISEEEGIIKIKISQKDKRILFLNEESIITNQVIRFKNDKISNIEIVDYVVFNDSIFIRNRTKLLNWVDKNHAELKGFLHNQTQKGGVKYLKAIELYQEANK